MNIPESIITDRSRENVLKIAAFACSSPARFQQLVNCVTGREKRLSELASWCLGWAARKKPAMMVPHLDAVTGLLEDTRLSNTVRRNILRIFEDLPVPEELHGRIMNICFGFVENPATEIAIRAFSLTTLFRLSSHYPEIRPELKLIIETLLPDASPAIRSRGRKILQSLASSGKENTAG
ncbi:hypothetical protein [Sediminibacterium soli]|uniref:hypothetical protein n=1 Tax=Sediminibacterium soli TaxID=2698829 RepID=UPI001379F862|nr:hypothetical protein [Sediminibacterium soli]NCI46331.1 hypothetical protein [Sediminibacterium soli]